MKTRMATPSARPGSAALPPGVLPLSLIAFLLFGAGPNMGFAALALATLMAVTSLLWRPGETPILVAILVFQWLQASIAIFHANWLQIDVRDYSTIPGPIETAILLSQGGLLCVAIGMRLGAGKPNVEAVAATRAIAAAASLPRMARLYIGAAIVSFVAMTFAWVVPGLVQIMIAFVTLKWAAYFLLAYTSLLSPKAPRIYLILAFLFELIQGIGGFFSDFKTVIYFTVFAAIAAGLRLSLKQMTGAVAATALAATLAIVWSAVKTEYRQFVSGGNADQSVVVDMPTRFAKLGELVGDLDLEKIGAGADLLVRRISYVEFFGATIDYVPRHQPHENGAILWDAITRPFMPRLFFPDKAVIDDTERTNRYTGGLAGINESTSISLGYIAEAYIDFGEYMMLPMLAVIGWMYGRLYRSLVGHPVRGGLLGMAVATAVLFIAFALESSITKIFGGIAVGWLLCFVATAWLVPALYPELLRSGRR